MTDTDGTVTTWTKASTGWQVTSVVQTGSASTSSYSYNVAGLPTRELGAVPTGVSCTSPDTTPGCRSLTFSYSTVAGASRLTGVNLVAYNPTTAAMATTQVAAYSYDSSGRLSAQWDPRITPNLKTTYTYDANGRISTLTPPGLAAWTFTYNTAGQLVTVSRPDPSGATAKTTVVYSVPTSGTGLPDVTATTAAGWGQTTDTAVVGTAIFGPNHVPAGTTAATVTAADWAWAHLDYLDVNGRTVNTAAYGAGTWQYDATQYDATGNSVWQLSAGNRAQAVSPSTYTDPAVAAVGAGTDRGNLLASTTVYNPTDPAHPTDTYGPTHPIVLSTGAVVDARAHVASVYDEGNPGGGVTGLVTTTTDSAQTLDGIDHDPIITHQGYDSINTGDTSGWTLGMPTTSTVQMGTAPSSADLVTTTRYNPAGQVIETRLPGGSAGATAQSTVTTYYTAGTPTAGCVNSAFAGMVCTTAPAAQPAGQPLPTVSYTYDMYGTVKTKTETAGTTVRTTTSTYDTAERPTGSSVSVSPTAAGGTALPAVTYGYDPATGLQTTQTAGGQTLTTAYDTLGRTVSYTDATGTTSTTGYDTAGRVTSINDGKGTTTYTYDTSSEHRGLVTTEDVGAGAAPSTFTITYTPAGQIESQTYPNSVAAWYHYDNSGAATSLVYAKGSTTWLSYLADYDAHGNMADQTGSGGNQHYTYDNDGRLTTTQDTQPTGSSTAACTTRLYAFDKDSNRTTLTSYPDGAGGTSATGSCTTTTTPTTTTSTFDAADRIITSGYVYDTLGRTLTVPAADAVGTGSKTGITGALAVGYFANDMVATQTQGAATRTYTLDPHQDRIAAISDGTATTVNHYSGDSDSPAWTSTGTAWIRNLCGADGGLAGTQTNTGTVTLQLANLHGDIAATANDDPAATTPAAQFAYTEYGQPDAPASSPDIYGWLGTHQRSAQPLGGLILMGVRLYNPATGRFLSVDPVPGGNANPYVYVLNPITKYDLNGKWWSWIKKAWHATTTYVSNNWRTWAAGAITIVGVAASAACGMTVICGIAYGAAVGLGVYVANNAGTRNWSTSNAVKSTLWGGFLEGYGTLAGRWLYKGQHGQ